MSLSYQRDEILHMYRTSKREPPQVVLTAQPNDVFSYGTAFTKRGVGYGPLRKTGSRVEGKYLPCSNNDDLNVYPFTCIDPMTEQEIWDKFPELKPKDL